MFFFIFLFMLYYSQTDRNFDALPDYCNPFAKPCATSKPRRGSKHDGVAKHEVKFMSY